MIEIPLCIRTVTLLDREEKLPQSLLILLILLLLFTPVQQFVLCRIGEFDPVAEQWRIGDGAIFQVAMSIANRCDFLVKDGLPMGGSDHMINRKETEGPQLWEAGLNRLEVVRPPLFVTMRTSDSSTSPSTFSA